MITDRILAIESDDRELRSGLVASNWIEWDTESSIEIEWDTGLGGYFSDAEIGALLRTIELCDDTETERIGNIDWDSTLDLVSVSKPKLADPTDRDVFEFDSETVDEIGELFIQIRERGLDPNQLLIEYLRQVLEE